jgi:hypothetical protein
MPTPRKTWTTRALTTPADCWRCEQMRGQTVEVGEQFTTPEGNKITAPPLHPNCDCIITVRND